MNPQLSNYINASLAAGLSAETIKQTLISKGWRLEQINSYFPTQVAPTLQTPVELPKNKWVEKIPSLSLRLGLAFVFLYAAVFVSGEAKTGAKYVPGFVTSIIPIHIFLLLFGVFEVLLALWLLSGKFKLYSGLVSALLLTVITLFNLSFFSVVFRNIAIIASAIALATL